MASPLPFKTAHLERDVKEKIPFIRITGENSKSIGVCHGRMLRDRIVRTWRWYEKLFMSIGATTAMLKKRAAHFQKIIQDFDKRYADEIDGIAEGSGLESYTIYCLNARTEIALDLLRTSNEQQESTECTSVFSPTTGVLAQNWDWDEELEQLACVSEISSSKKHVILTMHEPGLLAKTGMNSSGLGVCLNALHIPSDWKRGHLNGLPVHVILRAILDCTTFDDVKKMLNKAKIMGTSAHILLGAQDGRYRMIEFAGNILDFIQLPKDKMALHTNHYLGCESLKTHSKCGFPSDASSDSSSSRARYVRGTKLIENLKHVADIRAMKSLLRDDLGKFPICREMVKSSSSGGLAQALGRIGTVCSVVMDLKSLTMHITKGSPIRNKYMEYKISRKK